MGMIEINLLEPGMVLEEDAKDGKGFVLLLAGSVLASKHIEILRSWGVLEVAVVGVSNEQVRAREVAKMNPEQIEKVTTELHGLFRHSDLSSPETDEIFRHCLSRKLRAQRAASGS